MSSHSGVDVRPSKARNNSSSSSSNVPQELDIPFPIPVSFMPVSEEPVAIIKLESENGVSQGKTFQDVDEDEDDDENGRKKSRADIEKNAKRPKREFSSSFPISQVKRIMSINSDVHSVKPEAVVVMAKAVERFLQMFADEAVHNMQRSRNKSRRTINMEDISQVIEFNEDMAFLVDTFGPMTSTRNPPIEETERIQSAVL